MTAPRTKSNAVEGHGRPTPSEFVSAMAPVGSLAIGSDFDSHPEWHRLPLRSYPWIDNPPPHVVAAAEAAARKPEGVPSLGLKLLREALAKQLSSETASAVTPDEIAVTNGAMGALSVLWSALLEPGDEVVVPAPNYYVEGSILLAGAKFRPVLAISANCTDWDRIQQSITDSTKAVFLTNPNNPTGKAFTPDDLFALDELANAHPTVWLVIDESYEAVQHDGRSHLAAWRSGAIRDRSVIVRSFSKSYAVTWLRVGWLAAAPDVVRNVARVIEWQQLYGSCLNQRVALAVLEGDRSWLAPALAGFSQGRDMLYEQLAGIPGCAIGLPEAGPFLFPDISGITDDPTQIIGRLHQRGIFAIPGEFFAGPQTSFRVPVGGDQETQIAAAEVLSEVLGGR